MERISAAENITIEMDVARWRMLSNGSSPDTSVLLEATSGQPVNYQADFALTRRLPPTGRLSIEDIQRIVLGWSNSDESWHLGILLDNDLAEERGSRWCEIAHWPDPETTVYNDIATRAGESLAQVVTRPFAVVPPKPAPEPVTTPPPPLPAAPLGFDNLWTLQTAASGAVQLVRSPAWARTTLRRIVWYIFWVVVYIVLIYFSLTSGIAPANPPFLPYLGMVAAVILVGLIVKNIYQLLTWPNRIVFTAEQVRGLRGKQARWTVPVNDIKGIYVSQVMGRPRRKKSAAHYGELNLWLENGKFHHIINAENLEVYENEEAGEAESVTELTQHDFTTDLQAAGLYMAQALNRPAWYDRRQN